VVRSASSSPARDAIVPNPAQADDQLTALIAAGARLQVSDVSATPAHGRPRSLPGQGMPASMKNKLLETFKAGKEAREEKRNAFLRFEDIPGLVRMKSDAEPAAAAHLAQTGKGYGVRHGVLYAIAGKTIADYDEGYSPKIWGYQILVQDHTGKCMLKDPQTQVSTAPKDGTKYIFVTMEDGINRVSIAGADGLSAHARLAGHAGYVKYAGVLYFSDREPTGMGDSGTYRPPLAQAAALSGIQAKWSTTL
jgi:hypothetical protein